jgi:hypothetical protein
VQAQAKAPDELSLHHLVVQISHQSTSDLRSLDALERSHRLLTEADACCERIILLIDQADLLTPPAVRFLQLTSRSGPSLRVVLASTPAGAAHPTAAEFSVVSGRSVIIRMDATVMAIASGTSRAGRTGPTAPAAEPHPKGSDQAAQQLQVRPHAPILPKR